MNLLIGIAVAAAALLAFMMPSVNDDEDGPEPPGIPPVPVLPPTSVVPGLKPTTATPPPAGLVPGFKPTTGTGTPAPPTQQPNTPPPNVSGDPAGYNSTLYPDVMSVRKGLNFLGYPVVNDIQTAIPPSVVKQYQGDHNQAAILGFGDAVGWLNEDGVPGAYTLRALEIDVSGMDGITLDDVMRGYQWSQEFGL